MNPTFAPSPPRYIPSLLGIAALIGLLGVGGVTPLGAQQTLVILHTSEHHGTAMPIEERGQMKVGGMAGRATLVDKVRQQTAAVLLVDSGDILLGTALSSFFHGEPDIKAMNLMGYHAMAAGNHDFDFGLDHLRRMQELAHFPILCSNLAGRAVALPCQPSASVRVGDLSIGLIGLLGHRNFPDTFNREVVKILEFRDPIETARMLARRLKATKEADLVVAVTHQATDEDLALLSQVPEIDVIIGGHTEGFNGFRTVTAAGPVEALAVPGPVFVKTHRQGRTLGRLDLLVTKEPGDQPGEEGDAKVVWAKARNLPVTEDIAPDPAVTALLEDYVRSLETLTGTIIGRSLVTLDGESRRIRTGETNLGNLLADLLRAEFGTEIAFLNSGQIRDSIPAGPVDLKRAFEVLPFDSTMVTLAVAGRQLLLALENSASQLPGTSGRFLQVSGLSVAYDLSAPPGSRVREIQVGGRPLELTRRYTIATDSFLADGGDGFTMLATAETRLDRQVPMRDLLLAALRAGPLKASVEGRITMLGAPGQPAHPMPGP